MAGDGRLLFLCKHSTRLRGSVISHLPLHKIESKSWVHVERFKTHWLQSRWPSFEIWWIIVRWLLVSMLSLTGFIRSVVYSTYNGAIIQNAGGPTHSCLCWKLFANFDSWPALVFWVLPSCKMGMVGTNYSRAQNCNTRPQTHTHTFCRIQVYPSTKDM